MSKATSAFFWLWFARYIFSIPLCHVFEFIVCRIDNIVGSIYFIHSDTPFCLCIRLFNPFTFFFTIYLISISHLCILFSVYIMPQLLPLNSSTMNPTAYWTLLLWLTDTSIIIINTPKTEFPFFPKVCWSLFIYSIFWLVTSKGLFIQARYLGTFLRSSSLLDSH